MSIPLLQLKNITKSYGKKEVLKNITLDIFKGEIISFLGVNGAGKTTLSSIIATLHPATSGTIYFEGNSIYKNLITYRHVIGFCQQKSNLNPSLSLRQNLILAGSYYGMTVKDCETRINELKKILGFDEYLDQTASVLSGGFKQRFMIARSLMHRPQIILLDEPTVALDPHIRRQLWTIIKELKKNGSTIILTTHYLDEAEMLSDRVCLLDKGVMRIVDTPDKLKSDFQMNNLEDIFVRLMEETVIDKSDSEYQKEHYE
jgi:ABC-2 type transport system ATP-binding protein